MDGSRFDAWTRRRVGLTVGRFAAVGLAIWFGGSAEFRDAEAKKKKKRKKKKKKRCKAFDLGCSPGGKRKCCRGLQCAPASNLGGSRCCREDSQACALASECCSGFCLDDQCQPAECREIGNPCAGVPCCSGNCGLDDHCLPPLA